MAETIKIIGKRTGLGNQIQFIPIIQQLQKEYIVCSDSEVYSELGVITEPEKIADINMVVFGYNHEKLFRERLRQKGKFYGFKYRIKKKHIGVGYTKAIKFDEYQHEIDNNIRLYNYCFKKDIVNVPYQLEGWRPEAKTIVIGISPKQEKTLPHEVWQGIVLELRNMGYRVLIVDKDIGVEGYVKTTRLSDLKKVLSKAQYYIGTDSGVMHLADILGIPCLIMFGSTSIVKNQPYNGKSIVYSLNLECSPCFDWGRVNCPINFKCMDFTVEEILAKFKELCQNQ